MKRGKIRRHKLDMTGDDLALCMNGIALAMDWWHRGTRAKSAYARAEREKYIALNLKLHAIFDRAYPQLLDDGNDHALGDEIVLHVAEAPARKRGKA